MKEKVGSITCLLSFLFGNVLCYLDFFLHGEIGNSALFYLGQCLIYSSSFLGFSIILSKIKK